MQAQHPNYQVNVNVQEVQGAAAGRYYHANRKQNPKGIRPGYYIGNTGFPNRVRKGSYAVAETNNSVKFERIPKAHWINRDGVLLEILSALSNLLMTFLRYQLDRSAGLA